jgi:hypothetical protein
MNKWALLERNSMQQNEIYNIPLPGPRGPGPKNKKRDNERGYITRGELKRRIPHGDSVIDSDLTYKFWEYGSLFARCVRFEKPNKTDLPPSTTRARARFTPAIFPLAELPTPQDYQPHPLVPSLTASTFTFGALLWRYRELNLNFKLDHYRFKQI